MMHSVEETPVEDRVVRYREMSEHTRSLAERVQSPELRDAYLELAERWRALAESTGRTAALIDGMAAPALRDEESEAI